MNWDWDAIGAVGEILGAFAVFATLIYLARELAQTRNTAHLTAHDRIMRTFDEGNRLIVNDANLREALILKGEPSPVQYEQLYLFAVIKCNTWLSAQDALDRGQITPELHSGAVKDIRMTLERWPVLTEPFREWLRRYPEVANGAIFDRLREEVSPDGD